MFYICKKKEFCPSKVFRNKRPYCGAKSRDCPDVKIVGERQKAPIRMRLITLYLPEPYIENLDGLVEKQHYPNRAEAIRMAIRDMLTSESKEFKK